MADSAVFIQGDRLRCCAFIKFSSLSRNWAVTVLTGWPQEEQYCSLLLTSKLMIGGNPLPESGFSGISSIEKTGKFVSFCFYNVYSTGKILKFQWKNLPLPVVKTAGNSSGKIGTGKIHGCFSLSFLLSGLTSIRSSFCATSN